MKVQGALMQARFIDIHQVFAKQKKVGYFSNSTIRIGKSKKRWEDDIQEDAASLSKSRNWRLGA